MKKGTEIELEALNLRTRRLNGYKLLTVYSREYGLLKLSGSKLGGRSALLVHNKFWIKAGREDIHRILQSEFLNYWPALSLNIEKMSFALFFAELLEKLTNSYDPESPQIFELLIKAVQQLAEAPLQNTQLENIGLLFLWNLSKNLGYQPSVTLSDPQKHYTFNTENQPIVWFDLNAGELIYSSYQSTNNYSKDNLIQILPGIYRALQNLSKNQAISSPQANHFLFKLMQRYLQVHSPQKFKALPRLLPNSEF